LLDPDNTGALTVFAFEPHISKNIQECHVWVCEHETHASLIEEIVGVVEPGAAKVWSVGKYSTLSPAFTSCALEPDQLPPDWLVKFPHGKEIIQKTLELQPDDTRLTPDQRLIERRRCEYALFQSIEQAIELKRIQKGFSSVDDFISHAQTILQRRKSRAGRSLELHIRQIFIEEGLREGIDFSFQAVTEQGKQPDFLFPSAEYYQNPAFPKEKLRMLATKTTCRDRWRQVINEAKKIDEKHLLTLQEGISENQFTEMRTEGIKLVVPESLIKKYPKSIQPGLQTLESFIGDIRLLLTGL
jgi:hypothetical protein